MPHLENHRCGKVRQVRQIHTANLPHYPTPPVGGWVVRQVRQRENGGSIQGAANLMSNDGAMTPPPSITGEGMTTTRDRCIEAAARAMAERNCLLWNMMDGQLRSHYSRHATAALDAILAVLSEPDEAMRSAIVPAYTVGRGYGGATAFWPTLGGDGLSNWLAMLSTLSAAGRG